MECAIYRNVKVSDGSTENELGKKYGIVPNKFLLVQSTITAEKAERVEYFCEYYVSNLENYEEKLVHMISRAM